MEESKIDMFLLSRGDYFPADSIMFIKERLTFLDNDRWSILSTLSFRNPTTALLISVGAGILGVGRFYLGQPLLGILKLALIIVFYISYIACMFNDDFSVIMLICGVSLIAALIWWIVDLFLIPNTTRSINYNKLLTFIN